MTAEPLSKDELSDARKTLVDTIVGKMPDKHKQFLISFEAGEPDWTLLDVEDAKKLPAVKWRMQNLDGIAKNKRIALVTKLGEVRKHKVPEAQYTLFADKQEKRPTGSAS